MELLSRYREKTVTVCEKLFLYLFFLYTALGTNSLTYGNRVISFVMWPTFVLGAFLVAFRLFSVKKYRTMPCILAFFGLVFSICLSTLINYQYNFKGNVIFCIYWVFYALILYTLWHNKSHEILKKEWHRLTYVYAGYISLCVFVSLILFFLKFSDMHSAPDTGYEYAVGIMYGRLWGLFINPNTGAICSAVAAVILIGEWKSVKSVVLRIIIVTDIFLLTLFIVFSDSRSGMVCAGVTVMIYFLSVSLYKLKDKNIYQKIIAVILAVCIGIFTFFLPSIIKSGYNKIAIMSRPSVSFSQNEGDVSLVVIDRGYDISDDISNRRFDVWQSACEVFVNEPKGLLFGYSFKGFTDYAINNMPETYIVNNDYGIFTTLDNEIFNIMDSQGILGLAILLIFVVSLLIYIIKRLPNAPNEDTKSISLMLAVLGGFSVSAMFCSVMFYHLSPNSVLFWVTVGAIISLLDRRSEINGSRN